MILKRSIAALAACLALAACGNRSDQNQIFKTLSAGFLKKGDQQGGSATPEQVAIAIQQSLQGTDLPLALAVMDKRNATAILTRIETNGAYGTWGTSDRRTIILRGGLVTGTRGLGNDVMSAEIDAVAALVSARKGGTATRVQRYLDGENHTVALVAECTVARGGAKHVKIGEINTRVTEMTERCSAGQTQFENSYLVDPSGYAVQARQWLSPANGHISIQALRR